MQNLAYLSILREFMQLCNQMVLVVFKKSLLLLVSDYMAMVNEKNYAHGLYFVMLMVKSKVVTDKTS